MTRSKHWAKKKMILLRRDGPWCWLCRKVLTWNQMTFDHVIPRSKGGSHHTSNLRLACKGCNEQRGDSLKGAFGPLYEIYEPERS